MSRANCSPVVLRTKGAVAICGVYQDESAIKTLATIPMESAAMSWNDKCSILLINNDKTVKVVKLRNLQDSLTPPLIEDLVHPSSTTPGFLVKWASISPAGKYVTVLSQSSAGKQESSVHPYAGTSLTIWKTDNLSITATIPTISNFTSTHMTWRDDDELYAIFKNSTVAFSRASNNDLIMSLPIQANDVSMNIAPKRSGEESLIAFVFTTSVNDQNTGLLYVVNRPLRKLDDIAAVITPPPALPIPGNAKYLSTNYEPKVVEFSKVDGVDCAFSPSGKYMLCIASAQVDSLGQNYGSVGDVWLASLQSLSKPFRKMNKNLVQDAAWSPTRDEFIIIEGKSPSDCLLFDLTGDADPSSPLLIHSGYKNTIRWSPQGNMIAIGGFGNLAGDLAFFYRKNEGDFVKLAERRCQCTVKCQWSPCGQYFLTASLWPRMRVDNQINVWTRSAQPVAQFSSEVLYDVNWICGADNYPQLPPPEVTDEQIEGTNFFKPKGQTSDSSALIHSYISGKVKLEELPVYLQNKMKSSAKHIKSTKGGSKQDSRMWRGSTAESPYFTPESGTTVNTAAAPVKTKAKRQDISPAAKCRSDASTAPNTNVQDPKTTDIVVHDKPPLPNAIAPPLFHAPNPQIVNMCRDPYYPMVPSHDYREVCRSAPQDVMPPLIRCLDPPPALPLPASCEVNRLKPQSAMPQNEESIISLLQQILPPTSTVHVENKTIAPNIEGLRYTTTAPTPPPPPCPVPPSPPCKWLYKDPRGDIQGPFSRRQMRAWWEKGYFPHTLRVRTEQDAEFRPLSMYYPDPSSAFSF